MPIGKRLMITSLPAAPEAAGLPGKSVPRGQVTAICPAVRVTSSMAAFISRIA